MEKIRMIKIKDSLHRQIKIESALIGCTMREFVEKILTEHLENREEVKGKDKSVKAK